MQKMVVKYYNKQEYFLSLPLYGLLSTFCLWQWNIIFRLGSEITWSGELRQVIPSAQKRRRAQCMSWSRWWHVLPPRTYEWLTCHESVRGFEASGWRRFPVSCDKVDVESVIVRHQHQRLLVTTVPTYIPCLTFYLNAYDDRIFVVAADGEMVGNDRVDEYSSQMWDVFAHA